MKIIFFGTPRFAALSLEYLLDHGVDVAAVVTRPDRPKGRSSQLAPSPVKELILSKAPHIPILQPEKVSAPPFLEALAAFHADLFVVVVFGQILSQKLLDIPPLGCINTHPSLLPKHRGPTPIQGAILAGDMETGVVIQKMVREVDAGDVLATAKMALPPDLCFGDLEAQLCDLSKPLLLHVVRQYEHGVPPSTPQNHALATYTSKIDLARAEIHWDLPAQEIHNIVRAFSPRPGAWAWISSGSEKKRLKIIKSQVVNAQGVKGSLSGGVVYCGQGALQLLEVQPEGKRVMKAADWLRGQKNVSFLLN